MKRERDTSTASQQPRATHLERTFGRARRLHGGRPRRPLYLPWNARSSSNSDEPRMRNTITPRTTGPTARPFSFTAPCTRQSTRQGQGARPSTQHSTPRSTTPTQQPHRGGTHVSSQRPASTAAGSHAPTSGGEQRSSSSRPRVGVGGSGRAGAAQWVGHTRYPPPTPRECPAEQSTARPGERPATQRRRPPAAGTRFGCAHTSPSPPPPPLPLNSPPPSSRPPPSLLHLRRQPRGTSRPRPPPTQPRAPLRTLSLALVARVRVMFRSNFASATLRRCEETMVTMAKEAAWGETPATRLQKREEEGVCRSWESGVTHASQGG